MKLRKQIKNRVVAVAMLAVVLLCAFLLSKPELARASTNSDTFNNWFSSGSYHYEGALSGNMSGKRVEWKCEGADPIYFTVFLYDGKFNSGDFYSKSDFKCHYDIYEGDKRLYGFDVDVYGNTCKMFGRIYNCSINEDFLAPGMHRSVVDVNKYEAWRDSGTVEYCKGENIMLHLEASTVYGGWSKVGEDSGWISLDGEGLLGGQDDPIKSDKLGTLMGMEKKYQSYAEKGNGDGAITVTERTHHWGWNKETSTGLNLLDNDSFDSIEVYCYLKVYDVSKKNWITGNKEKIESDKFKKLFFVDKGDASKLVLEIKQTHIWNDILTKEVKEIGDALGANDALHNLDYSYDFYFQLIGCKDGKYYKGDYVHFKKDGSAEEINGGKFDTSTNTATEDEDGNLKENDDKKDGTGTGGTGNTYEDAKNDANANASKNDADSNLDLDSAKAFINQIADVPKMIGDLFSFFPNWVKYTAELGFAFIFILIVYKLIRG